MEVLSETEEFSVKKSTNLKVFKGNSDGNKRLTRSTELKKTEESPPKLVKKLPILTKVNIQNVPKGITITKKVIPTSPATNSDQKSQTTSKKSRSPTPNSSPEQISNSVQKFVAVNVKSEKTGPTHKKVTATDNPKRAEIQKVKLTKAQVAAMAKEGKIAVKDGQVYLRNSPNAPK